jgi:hypothetical protein
MIKTTGTPSSEHTGPTSAELVTFKNRNRIFEYNVVFQKLVTNSFADWAEIRRFCEENFFLKIINFNHILHQIIRLEIP